MLRRPVLASVMLVVGLLLVMAYAEPAGVNQTGVNAPGALAVADTPTSTATATRTATPTATPTSTVGPALNIVLGLSSNPMSCGTTITVFATVTDVNGHAVIDGTAVQFASSLGGVGTAFTSGGVASIAFGAPINFSGSVVIQASTATGATTQTVVTVVCTAVVPFQIVLSLGTATVCGSSNQISATVTDSLGRLVVDGTPVTFSTTIGTITPSAVTFGGVATAILSTPLNTAGTALITVTAGSISRQANVVISCTIAPTAVPATAVPPSQQVAGVPRLPSAGDGAAAVRNNPLLLYGGAALITVSLLMFAASVTPSRLRKHGQV